jgi:hypothetical protein
MGIIQSAETDAGLVVKWVEGESEEVIAVFTQDAIPLVKQMLSLLGSQLGQAMAKVAPTLLEEIGTGGFLAAATTLGTTALGTVAADALPDAQTVLQTAQMVLQATKASTSTVTPADTTAVATIQSAVDTQTSTQAQS